MSGQVTMKTLADNLGLALSTISKALNDYPDVSQETKKLVHMTAARMGYVPNQIARNLARKTSNTVGLIIPDITNAIYGELFKSVGDAARSSNVTIFLCDSNRREELESAYVLSVLETQAFGLIIAPITEKISHISAIINERLPVVFVGGKVYSPNENFVSSGNFEGGSMAVEYLYSLGHRNIAVLSDNNLSAANRRRMEGYRDAMLRYKLKPWLVTDPQNISDAQNSGYRLTKELAKNVLPSALFLVKDMMAVGVFQALHELGIRVPEDISVVGYDDINIASLPMINLTTIAQPKKEMGETALKMLLDIVRRQTHEKQHCYLKPRLVVRGSCAHFT